MAASSTEIPDSAADVNRGWTLAQRIGFGFMFCYFALYLVLCWRATAGASANPSESSIRLISA
jgi:hypothetical protein